VDRPAGAREPRLSRSPECPRRSERERPDSPSRASRTFHLHRGGRRHRRPSFRSRPQGRLAKTALAPPPPMAADDSNERGGMGGVAKRRTIRSTSSSDGSGRRGEDRCMRRAHQRPGVGAGEDPVWGSGFEAPHTPHTLRQAPPCNRARRARTTSATAPALTDPAGSGRPRSPARDRAGSSGILPCKSGEEAGKG